MSRLVARAEAWERAYKAFDSVNFAAFDFNTVKRSLLDYVKLYFPETFNDFIESSEFIAIVETFAYIAELTAYRLDVNANENFISTAQRKESVLRLAKLVSYTAARPMPARGLVKITSVSTSESVVDANGNDLANRTIRWNDTTNSSWKDQFVLVMNRVLEQEFGSVGPTDRFQVQDVLFELYSLNLVPLNTGVFSYNASVNGQTLPMELVPVTNDSKYGIIERRPSNNANFTFLYGQDGLGDSSDTTGFFCFTKQGTLQRFRTTFDGIIPNQTYDIAVDNVNDIDVWVNNVDPATGNILDLPSTLPYRRETLAGKSGEWIQVDLAHAQNVIFNTNPRRNKYEIETRDKNRVRLLFGDGEFADIPQGTFDIWARSSVDDDVMIPQSSVVNSTVSFSYVDALQRAQTFTFTFSLISSLQNASAAESIEQIRTTAPAVYYSQDRMVNGEDYNVFPLQDASILKLRAINRTFAGDSKYITWHDASGTYENVKIIGTDGVLYLQDKDTSIVTPSIDTNTLISSYIEPLLSSTDIFLHIVGVGIDLVDFRRLFTTDEKTQITTALTPPPSPCAVDMYFNKVENKWYAVKVSEGPVLALSNNGWPTQFIQEPLIKVRQNTIFDTKYTVTRVSRRMVMLSETTAFWNTNEASRVVEYDTLRSDADNIVILQANVNNNRNGILLADCSFDVLGQEVIESGPDLGLTDTSRLSVIPSDENQDGVPDNVSIDAFPDSQGIANIIKPKYTQNIGDLAIPQPLPSATGYILTLPLFFVVDPVTLLTDDVSITHDGIALTQDYDWSPAGVQVGGPYVTNKIAVKTKGTETSLGPTVDVQNVDIAITEYVYFTRSTLSDPWYVQPSTSDSAGSFVDDTIADTSLWKRHQGKANLNFVWLHRSPRYHLVDPSPTNIIDMFVITKGFYTAMKRWLEDPLATRPSPPTPLDLRNSYGYLLDNKMISDTVVLHPGNFKLLFGTKAAAPLRAQFKVIRSPDRTLTDNQIKTAIVTVVRNFFDVTSWEFGETFYFTELSAAIHNALATEISSVVLVPTLPENQFGDLFQVLAREDEVLYPDISVDNIEIVSGYTAVNLKQ